MNRILVKCPSCSNTNSVGGEHLNKHARCGACQTVFLVTDNTSGQSNSPAPTSNQPRNTVASPPIPQPQLPNPASPYAPQPHKSGGLPSQQTAFGPAGFRGHPCPVCQIEAGAYPREQISTAGWITFAVLLTFCGPLFWIGLLMKETSTHCSNCHSRIG